MENKNNTNVAGASTANKANVASTNSPKHSLALYYGIGAVVVILLIMFVSRGRETFDKVSTTQPLDIPTEDVSDGSVNAPVKKVPSISYADALIKYKEARIQIDEDCQAFPNNVTYKNGTSIMIDNRSAVNRTMKVGGIYTVKAYGFKIIKLDRPKLPETLLVDCDTYKNVATILVQQ